MTDKVINTMMITLWAAIFFAMIAQMRMWSVARDLRRIADALEAISLRNQGREVETNGVREYLD